MTFNSPEPDPPKTEETTFEPPPSVEETQEQARRRAEQCYAEVAQVLARYRCHIQPFLRPLEAVGVDGSKALVSASYGIIPEL